VGPAPIEEWFAQALQQHERPAYFQFLGGAPHYLRDLTPTGWSTGTVNSVMSEKLARLVFAQDSTTEAQEAGKAFSTGDRTGPVVLASMTNTAMVQYVEPTGQGCYGRGCEWRSVPGIPTRAA
jgi:hypothetical protein